MMKLKYWKNIIGIILVTVQLFCLLCLFITGPLLANDILAFILEIFSIFLGLWAIYVMRLSRLNIFPHLRNGAILITKGPYKLIRHPMYAAVILFGLSLIIELYSTERLAVVLILFFTLILKIEFEEKILIKELPGYQEYRSKTYKLIPFIY
ncbi:MAG: isoprenylcysteine carboxylmethyltransferase family protein [Bacteroidales bacterium]|nr:isoprenylcysteine carboxylmethyltransferase family protein [Bacteroidales bacterium]